MKYKYPLKKLSIIYSFYRNFLVFSSFISFWCLFLFFEYGFSILSNLIWFKIITLGLTYYFINEYKGKEYYYYQNLGVSKLELWISTLLFDFSLMIFFIFQISLLK